MPQIIEQTVYKFDELSDKAKERARDKWREHHLDYDWWEFIYGDFDSICQLLGVELDRKPVKLMNGKTRYDPCIWFSGFWSQGDGACFEGKYRYKKGAAKEIRKYAPNDKDLHQIADTLQTLQKAHFYRLVADVTHRSPHYYHAYSTDITVYDTEDEYRDIPEGTYEGVKEALRDLMKWLYVQLEKEYEWQMEDEQIDDSIIANTEYDFDEYGGRV